MDAGGVGILELLLRLVQTLRYRGLVLGAATPEPRLQRREAGRLHEHEAGAYAALPYLLHALFLGLPVLRQPLCIPS